jgi:hypothetical protein
MLGGVPDFYGQTKPTDEKAEFKFEPLFNGKDLTGWVYPGQKGKPMDGQTETPDGRIRVQDGRHRHRGPRINRGKGGIRDLYTAQSFDGDFSSAAGVFRAAPRADSGVYIRGVQLQVRDYPTVGPIQAKNRSKAAIGMSWTSSSAETNALCQCNGEVLTDRFKVPEKGPIGFAG